MTMTVLFEHIAKIERTRASAHHYLSSRTYNLFSYVAAKSTLLIADARLELAHRYLRRTS